MASNTENLNLLMKNPSTDGADTFNVQTMLNENWQKIDNNAGTVAQTLANILKPTTPPIIGLPPSTTPDGMFQALGNTGELHVWRKTVTNQHAGYELEKTTKTYITSGDTTSTGLVYFSISDSISVDNSGNVTQVSPSKNGPYAIKSGNVSALQEWLTGGFLMATTADGYDSNNVVNQGIWYIPKDAVISFVDNGTSLGYPHNYCFVIDKMQRVSSHGAGTTTTYPVSTNPNAYQEGDDAKEAGYTLGEVVTGNFQVGYLSNVSEVNWNYSDALNVADNGTLTLKNPTPAKINTATSSGYQNPSVLLGHFAVVTGHKENIPGSPFADEQIVYIPSNAVVSGMYIDRYQPVTGYAAIPAGTTIEYLGKLGDKARVQVVSYVGTGTYGSSNPNSLTFDFAPKVVLFLRGYKKGSTQFNYLYGSYGDDSLVIVTADLSETFSTYNGFGRYSSAYAKKDTTGHVISWYNTHDANSQANATGCTHYFLAIG